MNPISENISVQKNEWNAVYTKHQHEKTIAKSLAENGIEVFLPTYNTIRQWTDRKKQVSLPLFPCYVFLRGSFERRLKVLKTPGVHFLVMFAGQPAPIPDVEIDAIRKAVESGFGVEPHPFLRTGDWVRVRSGPLSDVEGILVRRKSSYRLVLSCVLLGKSVSVEVDAFSVSRVPRPSAPQRASLTQTVHLVERRIAG